MVSGEPVPAGATHASPPPVDENQVWQALEGVLDPELPVVNIVEMGIVRSVGLEGRTARVVITPTFSGCPALHVIRDDIAGAVRGLGLEAQVETVLYPPWSSDWINEGARGKLERFGIAPPAPANGLISLEPAPVRCPRCGSFHTQLKNTFGPTLCKMMYQCGACHEVFEAFKSV